MTKSSVSAALEYAQKGWSVFALIPGTKLPYKKEGVHSVEGKGGFYCATTDPEKLKLLFHDPKANLAIRTGVASGVLVLDIDSGIKDGRQCIGHLTLEELEAEFGKLPDTVEQITPSGGKQKFFEMPNGLIKSSAGVLGKDLDVRAEGGLAVLPPSTINGKNYEWLSDQSPFEIKIAKLPAAWIEKISSSSSVHSSAKPYKLPAKIEAGSRNNELFSYARSLFSRNEMNHVEVLAACMTNNHTRCFPPLPEGEVREIVESAYGYNGEEKSDGAQKINALSYAKKMIKAHRIIYATSGVYYHFIKGCYKEITENAILKKMSNDIGSRQMSFINLTLKYIESEAEIDVSKLNLDGNIINLENGLFKINSFELEEHNPGVLSTIQLPFSYDVNAKCPLWEKALKEILITDEQINLFQEMFGLCFTREVYGKAAVLIGEGRNGKSTLLKVLREMVGKDNICAVEPIHLDKPHNIARLHNKIANICTEVSAKGVMSDGPLKQIITGDPIEGCHKYDPPFTFDPYCKILFATNTLPHVDDKSVAFYDRLIIFEFLRRFERNEAVHDYHKNLLKEKSGIFNWGMEGFKRLKQRGYFELSAKMQNIIETYQKENNPIILFKDERCILAENAQIECSLLYKNYYNYCEDNGYKAYGRNKFSREIKRVCGEKITRDEKARPVIWFGINIRSAYEAREARKNLEA